MFDSEQEFMEDLILGINKGTFTIFDKILNFHGVVNLIITR